MQQYALRPKQTVCPVCSCHDGLVLYSVDSDQAAQHYVLREVEPDRHRTLRDHIESLWRQSTCDVVRCAECEFCFADPFIAGDARFYELAYQRTGYPQWKWEYGRTREALFSLKQRGCLDHFRLLEIGAGNGAFIKQVAPALTTKENVFCTEFSDFGRNAMTQYGVRCIPQDVRELSLHDWAGNFDVICMFQVLEHLDRLDELFSHLSSLASTKAHLFIGVPNAKRIEFNELYGSLLDLPPNHVGRWNLKSFEKIAHRHGWSVADYDIQHEGFKSKARQFALYRYIRRRQAGNSLANRIERIHSKSLRRPLQAFAVAWYAVTALPTLGSLVNGSDLGETQWAHMIKGKGQQHIGRDEAQCGVTNVT